LRSHPTGVGYADRAMALDLSVESSWTDPADDDANID
jgi:hypothetical protein